MTGTMRDLCYILFGYFSGSVLFARIFGQLLAGKDITQGTLDENPGAANAFCQGGFLCGALTLCCDLLKGFLPVFLYIRGGGQALALVLAAPVLGHIFPAYFGFRGGKGIAVSFGCLLGLLPNWLPVLVLALFFILYSVIIRIDPHYYRTLMTYLSAGIGILISGQSPQICFGYLLICGMVVIRLLSSREEKMKCEVHLLWKR